MNASKRILITSLIVGGISFIAGYVGPILFTDYNTGPLLGIFVTGPIGFLTGALIGIAWSIHRTTARNIRTELYWYLSIWLFALLYYYRFATIFKGLSLAIVGFQVLAIAVGVSLFVEEMVKGRFSRIGRIYGAIFLISAVLMLMMSMFPPVTEPWWVPKEARGTALKPAFAFFMNHHFDASIHYPEYAVDKNQLGLQWIITAAVTSLACWIVAKLNRKRKPDAM